MDSILGSMEGKCASVGIALIAAALLATSPNGFAQAKGGVLVAGENEFRIDEKVRVPPAAGTYFSVPKSAIELDGFPRKDRRVYQVNGRYRVELSTKFGGRLTIDGSDLGAMGGGGVPLR